MRVRWHVCWNARNRCCEIRAVIQVESAQKVLIGLAVTRVLGDHHPGDRLQQLPAPEQRQVLEVLFADRSLRRADRAPQQSLGAPVHHHLGHLGRGGGRLHLRAGGGRQAQEERGGNERGPASGAHR